MEEIDVFKTKIKEIEKLIIGTIEYDCSELINDLDFKEKIIIEEIKRIERKLKNIRVPE